MFAPHHALRAGITPAGRGRGARHTDAAAEWRVPETRLDDVGTTAKARVRDRDRDVSALRREAVQRLPRMSKRRTLLQLYGLLVRDYENSYLTFDPAASGPLDDLLGHSITYRVAMGPRAGQKVFTLQIVPAEPPEEQKKGVAQAAGFSLHAGIGIEAAAREKLERLCRYVSRPAVAEERLALTERGDVRVQLKTAYRDGTTHMILEPLDFLARLAALVPPPRAH